MKQYIYKLWRHKCNAVFNDKVIINVIVYPRIVLKCPTHSKCTLHNMVMSAYMLEVKCTMYTFSSNNKIIDILSIGLRMITKITHR